MNCLKYGDPIISEGKLIDPFLVLIVILIFIFIFSLTFLAMMVFEYIFVLSSLIVDKPICKQFHLVCCWVGDLCHTMGLDRYLLIKNSLIYLSFRDRKA